MKSKKIKKYGVNINLEIPEAKNMGELGSLVAQLLTAARDYSLIDFKIVSNSPYESTEIKKD